MRALPPVLAFCALPARGQTMDERPSVLDAPLLVIGTVSDMDVNLFRGRARELAAFFAGR